MDKPKNSEGLGRMTTEEENFGPITFGTTGEAALCDCGKIHRYTELEGYLGGEVEEDSWYTPDGDGDVIVFESKPAQFSGAVRVLIDESIPEKDAMRLLRKMAEFAERSLDELRREGEEQLRRERELEGKEDDLEASNPF